MLKGDIMKFDDLSSALLYENLEMKAIVAMARCLVWDAEKILLELKLRRFINKSLHN